jgi:hypothetical protein
MPWTDVAPADPTVVVGAGRAHFRYDDLCRLADLVVCENSSPGLRGVTIIELEHAAEALTALDRA